MSATSGSRDAPLIDRRAPRTPVRSPLVDRRAPGTPGRSARREPLPAWRKALSVVLWSVVVVCGFAYAVSLAVPLWFELHDERLLVVTSGSMSPKFDAG